MDQCTRTAVYPFLIKGWSSRRIADRLKVSLITIQTLIKKAAGNTGGEARERENKLGEFDA